MNIMQVSGDWNRYQCIFTFFPSRMKNYFTQTEITKTPQNPKREKLKFDG